MKLFLLSLLILVGSQALASESYKPFGAVLAELVTRNIFELNEEVVVIRDPAMTAALVAKAQSEPSLNFAYNSGELTHFGKATSEEVYLAKGIFCFKLMSYSFSGPKVMECAVGQRYASELSLPQYPQRFREMISSDHYDQMLIQLAKFNLSNLQTILQTEPQSYGKIQIVPTPWLQYIRRAGLTTFIGGMDQTQKMFVGRDQDSIIFCQAPGESPCTLVKLN